GPMTRHGVPFPFALGLSLAGALALSGAGVGCSGGGSSGGGSSSGSASATAGTGSGSGTGSATTTNPGTGFQGTDTTAPTLAADAASGRNTFHTMAGGFVTLTGTAADAESGVQAVTVNGAQALLGGTQTASTWSVDVAV